MRRLDGMPLAIELAAAQLDALGLGQLVAGLDDRFRVLVSQTRGGAARQASLGDGRVELPAFESARTAGVPPTVGFPCRVHLGRGAGCGGAGRPGHRAAPGPAVVASGAAGGPDGRVRYKMLETLRAYGSARLDQSGEREETAAAIAAWTEIRQKR